MDTTQNGVAHDVGRLLAYTPDQVEEFLQRASAERDSLRQEVDDARGRLAASRADAAASNAFRDHLGDLVLAAQRTAASRREAAGATIAGIVETAEREAEALLASAREAAATNRHGGPGDPGPDAGSAGGSNVDLTGSG